MTDRELLELAAKAFNIDPAWIDHQWNPLDDDGDALRLAVKLDLFVDIDGMVSYASDGTPCNDQCERHANNNNDPYAATRRVIVRAAAEIGKGMKDD